MVPPQWLPEFNRTGVRANLPAYRRYYRLGGVQPASTRFDSVTKRSSLNMGVPLPLQVGLLLIVLLLVSCGRQVDSLPCAATGENFLQDADFSLEAADPRSRHWSASQHAGEPSFETEIAGGVLTITKIGTQPWFILKQRIKDKRLGGSIVVYSADVKLDLREPKRAHYFGYGGGLSLVARSGDGRVLVRSILEHEPSIGTFDWQSVRVLVELPESTRTVEAGFLHQADGTLSVRNPSLRRVKNPLPECGWKNGSQHNKP